MFLKSIKKKKKKRNLTQSTQGSLSLILHFSLQVGYRVICWKTSSVTARAGTVRGTSGIVTFVEKDFEAT